MKHFILAVAFCIPLPALAQENGEVEQGFSLMEEGAKLLFRGIIDEIEPAIDDFKGMAKELEPALELLATKMGPALLDIMNRLDSVRYYEAPEILPNGDIIIRRSLDAPEYVPREPADNIQRAPVENPTETPNEEIDL